MSLAPIGDERLHALLEGLTGMAAGDTRQRLPLSDAHDALDAIAHGINVLADELRWTSERMAETERHATVELHRLKEEAERANEAKAVFLRNASHEIRTPIAVILSLADVLTSGGLPDTDRAGLLARLIANGQTLLALINNLLDLSRVDAEQVTLTLEPVSPLALVTDVLGGLEGEARRKGLSLRLQAGPAADVVIETDALRLRQILVNLVGNALKFTEAGSIDVGVRAVHDGDHSRIEIDVADTGIGIPGERQHLLFEPFGQGDASISRTHGGTGLGLALSRRLAERLGGTVTLVESTPGQGSRFRCAVDSRRAALSDAAPSPPPPRLERALDGYRILVVDDNDDLRTAIGLGLEHIGATIDTARDGYEAIVRALEGTFDVVLMDVHMPRLDGVEATKRLRSAECHVPVIALSADATAECQRTSLEAGCDRYVAKPFDMDDLVKSIQSLRATSSPKS